MTSQRRDFEELTAKVCRRRGWEWDPGRVELDLEGGRRQQVQIGYFRFEEQEMARFYSVIGPTRRIKPDRLVYALELNFRMPYGSMAVREGMLVLVDTLILADADANEVESTVAYLAESADQYERSMFGSDAY